MGRGQENFRSYDRKLSSKADEPQVGQRYEDVERNWEYYHTIIFLEMTGNFILIEKR